jgi:N-acetylneuraminic acid mutarotase
MTGVRRNSLVLAGLLFAISVPHTGEASSVRELGIAERIAAETAIEKVYYDHQIGTTRPFDRAITKETLAGSVRRYLGQSAALRDFWNAPIGSYELRNEMNRIARDTRSPERLHEVYAAVGHDAFILQECLARRTLADRWARALFAFDRRIHDGARREAEALQRRLSEDPVLLGTEDARRQVVELSRSRASDDERLRALAPARVGEIGPIVEEQDRFVIRAVLEDTPVLVRMVTYSVPKSTWEEWWRVVAQDFESRDVAAVAQEIDRLPVPASGRELDPDDLQSLALADSWDVGPTGEVPDGRDRGTAVWTGAEVIVWGGQRSIARLGNGGRYDPVTDTWHSLSLVNAPSPRFGHTAVWTGTRMVVWGGSAGASEEIGTGALYDPVTDTWTPTATNGAPTGRQVHTAVWTGSEMIVWGGEGNAINGSMVFLNDGGRYDPATDTWRTLTSDGAPDGRDLHTAVWTGSRMIVWGGLAYTFETGAVSLNTGGRYDPVSDSWQPTSLVGAPEKRYSHTAVWADHAMVVWGGSDAFSSTHIPVTGGRYDPESDVWAPISATGAPENRRGQSSVWTGSQMIVWGGDRPGGRYDPSTDVWTSVTTVGAPVPRSGLVMVWTGSSMIVWGGTVVGAHYPNSGGRYDPVLDRWTPTLSPNAPSERSRHSAVWTGSRMIVFGGSYIEDPLNSGGRYDPVTDSWTPTSPSARPMSTHTAVWAGDRMIVWGGGCYNFQQRGWSYDPIQDAWQYIGDVGYALAGVGHTSVWTGSRMIVWGGEVCDPQTGVRSVTSAGASYDPASNSWQLLSTVKAPGPRRGHTAVWTGSRMLVWGGTDLDNRQHYFDTGGAFDPATNAWSAMSKSRAPSGRTQHTAVWTGSDMLVWGGTAKSSVNSGGRYDPVTDRWRATSTQLAPTPRVNHTAVWTGARMVVWGGEGTVGVAGNLLSSGGRYDPIADTWSPTSPTGAPMARTGHTAVWTGQFMVVWGGYGAYTLDSLGRYVPD